MSRWLCRVESYLRPTPAVSVCTIENCRGSRNKHKVHVVLTHKISPQCHNGSKLMDTEVLWQLHYKRIQRMLAINIFSSMIDSILALARQAA